MSGSERQSRLGAWRWPQRLSAHPLVARVLYPGLPQHPGHDIAAQRRWTGGFGYMLSVQVVGGEAAAVKAAAHVELYKRATSLGGVESLIEHRACDRGTRARPARRTCCASRPASRISRISMPISTRR